MKYEYIIEFRVKSLSSELFTIHVDSDNDFDAIEIAKRRIEKSIESSDILDVKVVKKIPLAVCECHGMGIFIASIEGKEHFICGVIHEECKIEDC